MSNVEHSTITDPNIHEPKGIASASANTVYIADGSGSGSWGSINPLLPSIDPFSSYMSLYTTLGSLGSVSWSSSASSWHTLNLTGTDVNNISSATVSTNSFSLPSGTYQAIGYGGGVIPIFTTSPVTICALGMRIYNLTDSSDTLVGGSGYTTTNLSGRFTLLSTKTLAVQYHVYCQLKDGSLPTWSNSGGIFSGSTERVMGLNIWKVA